MGKHDYPTLEQETTFDTLADYLYALSLDSAQDQDCGSVFENGTWYALFTFTCISDVKHILRSCKELTLNGFPVGAILTEDSQGFKTSQMFYHFNELSVMWEIITDEVNDFYENTEEEL